MFEKGGSGHGAQGDGNGQARVSLAAEYINNVIVYDLYTITYS